MKLNKAVVSLMLGSSLLGGVIVTNNVNTPVIQAKSTKSNKVITDKDINDRKVKITFDTSKVGVFNQDGKKVILVKANIKNIGSKQVSADISQYVKATQTKEGVVSDLDITLPYSDELPEDWKTLNDNHEKDLEKGASIDTAVAFILDNDKSVVLKASDKGKGKVTIKNINSLPEIKTASDSDSEE